MHICEGRVTDRGMICAKVASSRNPHARTPGTERHVCPIEVQQCARCDLKADLLACKFPPCQWTVADGVSRTQCRPLKAKWYGSGAINSILSLYAACPLHTHMSTWALPILHWRVSQCNFSLRRGESAVHHAASASVDELGERISSKATSDLITINSLYPENITFQYRVWKWFPIIQNIEQQRHTLTISYVMKSNWTDPFWNTPKNYKVFQKQPN